jgi:ligand-binding SRPBCC domain-containing protein
VSGRATHPPTRETSASLASCPVAVTPGSRAQIERRWGGTYRLSTELRLAADLDEVFRFFSDAHNLEAITPPWLRFRILTRAPIEMAVGTRVDYRLRIRGVPVRWQSEIAAWDPPYRFVDVQTRGPYRRWVHEHNFRAEADGTRIWDRVDYALFGGRFTNDLLVARDLQRIFAYRHATLEAIFGNGRSTGSNPDRNAF